MISFRAVRKSQSTHKKHSIKTLFLEVLPNNFEHLGSHCSRIGSSVVGLKQNGHNIRRLRPLLAMIASNRSGDRVRVEVKKGFLKTGLPVSPGSSGFLPSDVIF